MLDEVCGKPVSTKVKVVPDSKKLYFDKIYDEHLPNLLTFFKNAYNIDIPEYQKEFLQHLENEVKHRERIVDHFYDCENCNTRYKISAQIERVKFRDSWDLSATYKTEMWCCFRCGKPIHTKGIIIKILSVGSKFEYNRRENAIRKCTKDI